MQVSSVNKPSFLLNLTKYLYGCYGDESVENKMDFVEAQPLVAPANLQDAPVQAVSEFFHSKSCGISTNLQAPDWDRVPPSSEQSLVEAARCLETAERERESGREDREERLVRLQEAWENIEQLQLELKNCFIHTESQVKELQQGESDEVESQRAATMKARAEWLQRRTGELVIMKDCIEDETRRLAPYQEFLAELAAAHKDVYPAGSTSVLQHYERLCSARTELDTRQAQALEQLRALRGETETFTARALAQLDAQQARVADLREQLQTETKLRDEWSTKLRQLRETSQSSAAEESELRAAIENLYEQLWRRYHPETCRAPRKTIHQQCRYIQLTMAALERLVEHRNQAGPQLSASLEPQTTGEHANTRYLH